MELAGAWESGHQLSADASLTPEAVATLYLPLVHRFAVMVSPRSRDPEDLAQDALLRVLERLDQFDPRRGPFEAWLWRVVLNTARDAGRAARRREFLLERLAGHRATSDTAHGVEDAALQAIRDRDLLAAVQRLPRRYRTLIALRYGAGLTSSEAASVLGITRMSAAKASRRALDRLREDLGRTLQ